MTTSIEARLRRPHERRPDLLATGSAAQAPKTDYCDVYHGITPHMWWPWNIDDLKKQLLADLQAADLAQQACQGLDVAIRAQWQVFLNNATEWAKSSTNWFGIGAQADQGQSYQCQLYVWQQRLANQQCAVVFRNPDPSGSGGLTPDPSATANAIRWGSIALASLAGAYVVGQVVGLTGEAMRLVPKPAPRK